jgi:hypothetical protein
MTQRYTHIADSQLRDAARAIDGLFRREGEAVDFEDIKSMKPEDAKKILLDILDEADKAMTEEAGPEPEDISPQD